MSVYVLVISCANCGCPLEEHDDGPCELCSCQAFSWADESGRDDDAE